MPADKAPTLMEAVEQFMGPLLAEYARLIEEGDPDAQLVLEIQGYRYFTKLRDLQTLDRAHSAAWDARQKRRANRAKATLL